MAKQKSPKIDARQAKQKELLLEQLKKLPIVQIACEKVGISRATYYRWLEDDTGFREAAETSITEGATLVNDLAEAQLISAIKDKNFAAISFWLRNRHKAYGDKLRVEAAIKPASLSEDEKKEIMQALTHLKLTSSYEENKE